MAVEDMGVGPQGQTGWSSRSAFILAAIGSAVGLGNLWRFPSEAGANGGGAFVVFYIGCVVLIGLPLLLSETLIGRHGRASAVGSARKFAVESGASRSWGALASVGMWGAFLILTFYSVVAGWVLYYIGLFLGDIMQSGLASGAFAGQSNDTVAGYMDTLFASDKTMLSLHAVFMVITIGVVMRGISGGIEKVAVYLMPVFFFLFLAITVYSLATGDASAALKFLFAFEPARLLKGDVMLSALGQAFFSLSLGSALMITYGAYADRQTNLAGTSVIIAGADTLVAIIAGLAIFPIVFAAGLDPAGGPTLMFQTLPIAFQNMPWGTLIGLLFFVMVFFAALTSSVALLEAPVSRAMEVFGTSRALTSLCVGGVAFAIGTLAALSISGSVSFQLPSTVPLLGGQSVFDMLDSLSGKLLLPLSGLLTAIFVGWIADKRLIDSENGLEGNLHVIWRFLVAWLCPLAVGVILVYGIFSG